MGQSQNAFKNIRKTDFLTSKVNVTSGQKVCQYQFIFQKCPIF